MEYSHVQERRYEITQEKKEKERNKGIKKESKDGRNTCCSTTE
jgi:hypothetical protein